MVTAAALCVGGATPGRAQFTSFNDRSRSILEGHWQSCQEDDGKYSERIFESRAPGIGAFELHLGPYHDFALFTGVQDQHREHDSASNLLQPHEVPLVGGTAKQKWVVRGLVFEVTLAGGSRDECESWWVALRRADLTSSH